MFAVGLPRLERDRPALAGLHGEHGRLEARDHLAVALNIGEGRAPLGGVENLAVLE